ncbi:MAG: acetyl-CoA decarbonylase/synthase complex subunit delta, partial [Candidatus Omnitrophica bacterium]|nr:acetyl-CoA decarbonylase/synthase complex subunit delta [Candidatus Omnitrophota bacterium]
MALSLLKEKWTNKINTLKIGAVKEEGGTRASTITVGGEGTLPFLFDEGDMPNPPVIAMEVLDAAPKDWPPALSDNFKDVLGDPVKWAEKCVSKYNAKLLALKLQSTHPEWGDASPEAAAKTVKSVLSAVGVPLILLGSGDQEKDNVVLAK